MHTQLILRLCTAACELEAARDEIGTDDAVMPLWMRLQEIQNEIEAVIKDEASV